MLPGNADLANVHLYPANGDPPSWYVSAIFNAQYGKPITAPFAVTEAGYNSDPDTTNGVSLNVQVKQTLSLVLDAAQSGASSIYLYELLDHYADPANTNADNHWGLFNSDGTPKPVATALHNLTTILADPGSTTANTTSLGSVSYSSPKHALGENP